MVGGKCRLMALGTILSDGRASKQGKPFQPWELWASFPTPNLTQESFLPSDPKQEERVEQTASNCYLFHYFTSCHHMFPGTLHLPGGCYPCRRMRLHLRRPLWAGHCGQPHCGAQSGEEVPGFGALVIYRATENGGSWWLMWETQMP